MLRNVWLFPFLVAGLVACPAPGAVDADEAQDLYREGVVLLKDGQVDSAIGVLKRAVQLQPNLAAAHAALGKAFMQQGSTDAAIASFRAAAKLKPEARHYISLGAALRKKGDLPEAVDAFRKAVEADPEDSNGYLHLGHACLEQGANAEAVASYQSALSLQTPDSVAVFLNLATANQRQGNPEEALKYFQAYLRAFPAAGNAEQVRQQVAELIRARRR